MRPTPIDWRDKRFTFHRHFGTNVVFPTTFTVDSVNSFPDQNGENRPEECTAYTTTTLWQNSTGIPYSRDFQFMKTLQYMGATTDAAGADARTAFKVGCSVGFLPKSLEPEQMATKSESQAANPDNWPLSLDSQTRNAPSFTPIQPDISQDWYDAIRNAIFAAKQPVGMATQWSRDFNNTTILPMPASLFWGHMYEAVGWNEQGLILNTWQGEYKTMSRAVCNKLMGQWGAFAAAFSDIDPGTVQKQTYIMEAIIAFLSNLIHGVWYLGKVWGGGRP